MRGWGSDRLRSATLFSTLLLIIAWCASVNAQPAAPAAPFVPGEVLVKFTTGVSTQKATSVFTSAGLQSVRHFASIDVHRCKLPEGMDVESAIAALKADPSVAFAEPNYIYTASREPNDPRFPELWAMQNAAGTDIDAPEAWETQTGSPDVVVGVIDTGVDYTHEDLQGSMWRNPGESGNGRETNGIDDDANGFVDDVFGWDFANNDNDPMDDNEHGSHVSGTIAAVGDNGVGVAGVNWHASIMALKFLSGNGSGTSADAVEAILYATRNGARILNNSWGGGGFSQALLEAIQFARDHGVLFVAAAGNDGRDNDRTPNYPSNYDVDNVVAVAAYDAQDALAGFSNYGRTTVDLGAPGVDILSTTPGNTYQSFSGTSMATPHVAGVAALVLAQYPQASYHELAIRVVGSVVPTPALDVKTWSGGRLNAAAALAAGPKVAFVTRLPDTSDAAGPYEVQAQAVADAGVQQVALTYTVAGTPPVTVPMPETASGGYGAAIPGQALGSVVSYFVEVADAGGATVRSRSNTFQIGDTAVTPGCGQFQFTNGLTTQKRVLVALFNLVLLAAAIFGARKLIAARRSPATAKH